MRRLIVSIYYINFVAYDKKYWIRNIIKSRSYKNRLHLRTSITFRYPAIKRSITN